MDNNINIKSSEHSISNKNENNEDTNNNKILNIKVIDNSLSFQNDSKDIMIEKEKNNTLLTQNKSLSSNIEKDKRQRRGKNDVSDRIYKCPDCEKSYLSGPALMIHRKLKHNFNQINENKTRGRPKKDYQLENSYNIAQNKYNNFLNNHNKRKHSLTETEDNENHNIINLEQIKNNLQDIFNQFKIDLFQNIDNIQNYSFYQLLINKWNEEKIELNMESYKDNYYNNYNNDDKKVNHLKYTAPSLDYVFILYLKELSLITNKEFFLFINKFIIIFREWINNKKKDIIKDEYKTEYKKDFSQLFSAEGVPDYCNDFFIEYLEINKFFGLNIDELIELTQHFCFWLFLKKYSPNYLLPIKIKE